MKNVAASFRTFYYPILMMIGCCICLTASAQSTTEDNVAFVYGTGQRSDGKLKVLIIGTHLMRFSPNNLPLNSDIHNRILLGFREILEDMEYKEKVAGLADYHNIKFDKVEVEAYTGSELHHTKATQYGIRSNESKISAMEKVRRGIIDEYFAKGYKIYQINYDPTNYNDFTYYTGSEYLPLRYSQHSAISTLWISYYRQGDIKSMLNSLGGFDNKSGNSSASREREREKIEEERLRVMAEFNRNRAANLEIEADNMYAMGTLFYAQALEKYQEANSLYYTDRVQERINYIESLYAFGAAINQAGEKIDEFVDALDPMEKTKFTYGFINYTGLVGNFSKLNNPMNQAPMGTYLGINGHRLLFSMEFRMGYMVSPTYEFRLNKIPANSSYQTEIPANEIARIQSGSVGLGLSGGLNIPLKNMLFYGLYGFDCSLPVSATVLNEDFKFDQIPSVLPIFNTKLTVGTIVNIPKTKMALGVQYNFNSIKGEKDESTSSRIIKTSDKDTRYYLGKTVDEIYKFNNLGISLLFDIN